MGYGQGVNGGGPNHFLSHLRISVGREIGRNAKRRGDFETAEEGYEMALDEIETYQAQIEHLLEEKDLEIERVDELKEVRELLSYWERTLEKELERIYTGSAR